MMPLMVDPRRAGASFAGLPVVAHLSAAGETDAIVVTELNRPQATYDSLTSLMPQDHVPAASRLRMAAISDAAAGQELAADR